MGKQSWHRLSIILHLLNFNFALADYKLVDGMPSCWDSPGLTTAVQPSNYYIARSLAFKEGERSAFLNWIQYDLRHWQKNGITKEVMDAAEQTTHACSGDRIRIYIVNGTLYVKHITARPDSGWFPSANLGEAFGKARVPYAIFAILSVLRLFPGQIPDLEAILQTADFTCVKESGDKDNPAPPTFGYTAADGFVDIPFPDPGWWGNEYHYIQEPGGAPPQGWERQWQYFQTKWENVSFAHRVPVAMWRGRVEDDWDPSRDALRRDFVGCVDHFNERNRSSDAALINVRGPKNICLHDTCDFRYPVYLESKAYSGSLRFKLACGSVPVMNHPNYREWWVRGLRPGVHFMEVKGGERGEMCEGVANMLRQANRAMDAHDGAMYRKFRKEEVEVVRQGRGAEWLSDLEARVQASNRTAWGTNLWPWEIGLAAREYMRQRVRMEDVYLYLRDALVEYGRLMRYTPRVDGGYMTCYSNGSALLEQYGAAHHEDRDRMAAEHPWLEDYQRCGDN